MKKKLFIISVCLTLMAGCMSLEKRDYYDDTFSFGRFKEMPYFPTYTVPNSESQTLRNYFSTVSIIGIPLVVLDYASSTVLDIVLLPLDIYRNNVVIPERQKYKKVLDELLVDYTDAVEKLRHAKTEKEKKIIKEKYKKSLDEYCDRLKELDANYVFDSRPQDMYSLE
ncbi:YceK/YidQ family lipoprotein [uncultured Fusobacterium sp.]|uniref:YceK/YidQ family lipoprotein n=1 Tax=uncultured Fusobacterium sp. TaxID=159267 RepID=UPI0015A591FD|nr:YceK/YidQ family lipoprotein [uncultured Fusobacterium sp.]